MQTFLPYPSLEKSVKCLDSKRLNKQIVECYQILKVLNNETKGYKHHPAVLMWQGYDQGLISYAVSCCREYEVRYKKIHSIEDKLRLYCNNTQIRFPKWYGTYKFHESHRSNLYRKDPVHYKEFEVDNRNVKAYCWPIEVNGELVMRYKVAGDKKYLNEESK